VDSIDWEIELACTEICVDGNKASDHWELCGCGVPEARDDEELGYSVDVHDWGKWVIVKSGAGTKDAAIDAGKYQAFAYGWRNLVNVWRNGDCIYSFYPEGMEWLREAQGR
jgi:hypothetical protein